MLRKIIILNIVIAIHSGCAHKVTPNIAPGAVLEQNEELKQEPEAQLVEDTDEKYDGLSVIAQGDGVLGLFSAGALKSLMLAKTPINEIYMIGVGALGATVAMFSKSPHLVEWNIKKLNLNEVIEPGVAIQEGKLRSALYSLFGDAETDQIRGRMFYYIDGKWTSEGKLVDLVTQSMALNSRELKENIVIPSETEENLLRVVLCPNSDESMLCNDENELRIVAKNRVIDSGDYKKINQVVFSGKKAAESRIQEIHSRINLTNK